MNSVLETQKVYQNHRENQRGRILDAAEKLMINAGIDNVSMNAISRAARIARKTLYEYFPNKLEVAFAIYQNFMDERVVEFDPKRIPEGNGFQRLEFLLLDTVNMLETYPEHTRFLAEFSALYAREFDPARVRRVYATLGGELFTSVIRQGIMDGSIRSDLDSNFLTAAIFNLISGMNSRFALGGQKITDEFGLSGVALYREILHIFLRGIQPNDSVKGNSG